ncbi:MAG: family NAD(P)-dependent oxidoreductase [Rubritepida sp.]|nr:family NAD(P)-dependent oxidoreductase [Rubritepida sp.]
MAAWNVEHIPPQNGRPSQQGRLTIVTGATSGIGFETALALAGAGASVILASRNAAKGAEALARIRAVHPLADITFKGLDLASLASVQDFCECVTWENRRVHLLVNNAGVLAIPDRRVTEDGFEMQLGANYLGHFALTLRLLPRLLAAPAPRVVTVSSLAHRSGRIHFDDLQLERGYRPWTAYTQSKLATLIFSLELERRARAQGWDLMSNAAHPGYARTGLQSTGPQMGRSGPGLMQRVGSVLEPFLSQSAANGALPTLFAATSPEAEGGTMYGPDGFYELKGPPRRAHILDHALDRDVAARLWEVSEQLTGVSEEPFRQAA